MEECNRVGIERAETYLTDSDVQEKTSYDGNVDQIETCIVYEGSTRSTSKSAGMNGTTAGKS